MSDLVFVVAVASIMLGASLGLALSGSLVLTCLYEMIRGKIRGKS